MKQFKRALRLLVLLIAGAILGLGIFSWNARSLTGDVMPMPFGYGASVVLSGSMEPTLAVNELIIVRGDDTYEVGDVVVYQTGRMLVVHRIVAMDGETVTTQGDANNVADEAVEMARIKGKVIANIPHVGVAVRLLKTPVATILLIAGIVLTIELPFQKEKGKKEEELQQIKEEIRRLKEEL